MSLARSVKSQTVRKFARAMLGERRVALQSHVEPRMLALGHSLLHSLRIVKARPLTVRAPAGINLLSTWSRIKKSLDQRIGLARAMDGRGIAAWIIDALPRGSKMCGVATALFEGEFRTHTHSRRRWLLCLCVFFVCIYFIGCLLDRGCLSYRGCLLGRGCSGDRG
jgi:hypothetical protein